MAAPNNVEGGVGEERGAGQGRVDGSGPHGHRAQLQLASLRLATFLLLCSAPGHRARRANQPDQLPGSSSQPGPSTRQGSQLEGRLFFLASCLLLLLGPLLIQGWLMGWKSVSGGGQGSSKTSGPVMCSGSLLSPTRESPGPPGHQPSAAPCSVPDSCCCHASTRSGSTQQARSTQHRPRHWPHRTQNSNIQPLHLSTSDPGGMTPAWARPRRRITSACRDGGGF